ncbi:MAG: hypothetical protein PHG67_06200 [Bacteroidales bacterium]|jgi:hypothetical protein|nr:hypothetical protein [Bacteroidales bacterium]
MSKAVQIKEAIQQMIQTGTTLWLFTAEITAVQQNTVTVKYTDLELNNVKLYSILTPGNLLCKPKTGSMATIADLSGGKLRDLVLLKADELQQIIFDENGLYIDIDTTTGLIEIKNNNQSLKGLLNDLADIIKSLKVNVLAPNAPSGSVTPDTLLKVTQFETALQQLLK